MQYFFESHNRKRRAAYHNHSKSQRKKEGLNPLSIFPSFDFRDENIPVTQSEKPVSNDMRLLNIHRKVSRGICFLDIIGSYDMSCSSHFFNPDISCHHRQQKDIFDHKIARWIVVCHL